MTEPPASATTATPPMTEPRQAPACQLVADVGNTETVFGLVSFSGDQVFDHWRISTGVPRTEAEYQVLLSALLSRARRPEDASPNPIRRAVVGSVVPAATPVLKSALSSLLDAPTVIVTPESKLPIQLAVEEPLTVGVDRILNTLAAKVRFGRDTIAVDLGTATTFDCITAQGVFLGGVIAPGLAAGLEWLAKRTAKLPAVDLVPPRGVVGRRTEDCIQSGVFYSAVDSVNGIVARIKKEWRDADEQRDPGSPAAAPLVVATGGFAATIGAHASAVDRVEPLLTLQGLGIAGAHLAGASPSP